MSRIGKLRQMLEKNPDDVFLNFGLAMELAKSLEIDQAVGQFDRVLQLDARYIPGYFQKGSALLSAGRRDDARAALLAGIAAARASGDPHAADEMQALLDSVV